jgi:transposase InsO family protein
VILDTTRLDVFGIDPITLRWTRIELTAAMDWYTRCIVGLRLTPVSTKAVDAAAMMFQVYRRHRRVGPTTLCGHITVSPEQSSSTPINSSPPRARRHPGLR